jgi:hypothetical protein
MKANLKRLIFLAIFLAVLIIPYLVFAQTAAPTADTGSTPNAIKNMQTTADSGGYVTADVDETTISTIAGRVVAAVLGLLGVLFISLMVYGGGLWMTAQGSEDQVEKAKTVIKNSTIGLIVIVSAGAIFLVVARIFRTGI